MHSSTDLRGVEGNPVKYHHSNILKSIIWFPQYKDSIVKPWVIQGESASNTPNGRPGIRWYNRMIHWSHQDLAIGSNKPPEHAKRWKWRTCAIQKLKLRIKNQWLNIYIYIWYICIIIKYYIYIIIYTIFLYIIYIYVCVWPFLNACFDADRSRTIFLGPNFQWRQFSKVVQHNPSNRHSRSHGNSRNFR